MGRHGTHENGHAPSLAHRAVVAAFEDLIQDGLRETLDRATDLTIVSEGVSDMELLEALEVLRPDVAICNARELNWPMDISRYQGQHGASLVVVADDPSPEHVRSYRAHGAVDVVARDATSSTIAQVVRLACDGMRAVPARPLPPAGADLTPAETEVFDLLMRGMSASQICRARTTSLATTKSQKGRIFDKTGVRSVAALKELVCGSGPLPPRWPS